MPKQDSATALYRHYDSSGALLYIGISVNPFRRTYEHTRVGEWMKSVVRIEVEYYETRSEALYAEARAIDDELPSNNVNHSNGEQTTYLGVRLTPEMKFRLEEEAERRKLKTCKRVTTTDIVRYLIEAYLPSYPRKIVRTK